MRCFAIVWMFALPVSSPAQDLPAYALPDGVAAKVGGLVHGEPLSLLADLTGMDLERRAAAEAVWDQLEVGEQCALVRAGLRATPSIAIGAAAKAGTGRWLDPAELKRAAQVGLAACNRVNTAFDIGDFFGMLDARDTAQLLANPGEPPFEEPQFFGALHQRLGPEHQAQVELLTRSDNVLLRRDAAKYLGVVRPDRERYAHFLLSQPLAEPELPDGFDAMRDRLPFQPASFTLRPAGDGYPPVLAAVLDRVFLTAAPAPSAPSGREQGDRVFAWRWARDCVPGELDRPALARLLHCDSDEGQRVGLRILQKIGAPDAMQMLGELADRADGRSLAPLLAAAELVRRGDPAARRRLGGLARTEAMALMVLWSCDREAALATVDCAMGADAVNGLAALQLLQEARTDGEWWGEPMEGLDDVLRQRATVSDLDAARLACLLESPEVRTESLGMRAIHALDAGNLKAMPLGVLELAGAESLANALRGVLDVGDPGHEAREIAVGALSRLGRIGLGDERQCAHLWRQIGLLQQAEDRAKVRIRCAASGSAPLTALLKAEAETARWHPDWDTAGLAGALAAAGGIDTRLALALADELHELGDERMSAAEAVLRAPLLAGDGAAAMAAYLAARPISAGPLPYLWTLGSPGLGYLQRCRAARESGLYCWATGELSRGGDAGARREVEAAIGNRLYGWIDALDEDVLTDGSSLDRVPLLLRQVDSNCCTFAVIGTALEDVFECDPFVPEIGARSRADALRSAWQRCQGRLRWSRIDSKWLIAPK